jgi:2-(3-amino-3-carboxypropyl)histidine synthase
MKEYNLQDLEKYYNLDLEKVIAQIKKQKAKLILLQFPDGLKQYATSVVDHLREKTNAEFLIWLGSCYGACDTPTGIEKIKPSVDLVIQFGHNELMPSY